MKRLSFLLICLVLVITCQARTITVDDDGPADFNNIQAAIDNSDDGDIVIVKPGIYTGLGNRDIDFKGKAITVRSSNPNDLNIAAATIIDCNGTAGEPHRGFYFHGREDPNSVLMGLLIANGRQSKGGAIYCDEHCSPTITHCLIMNNSAQRGGGIYCRGLETRPVISNCRISHNSASGPSEMFIFGGGIACDDLSSPLIKSCLITNNSAEAGGGIYFFSSNAHLAHCTVVGNSAAEGEGIYCSGWIQPGQGLLISNSIVWGNSGADGPDIAGSAPIVSYSNVEGGYPGTSNIDADPLFVHLGNGDYHLTAGSPCIDSGEPDYLPDSQTDIDGEPRMMGFRVDIGADEFTDEVLRISHRLVFLANQGGPNPPAETIVIENIGSGVTTWQVVEDCPWLDITPRHGQTAGESIEATVNIDILGLGPGSYNCQFQIVPDVDANSTQTVIVVLHVSRWMPLNVPQQYSTIQAAIDAAAWGDTVLVATGTYSENINFKGKNIILTSTEPNDPGVVAATVIQGDGTASVVIFLGTENSTCQLRGFTITGGDAILPHHGGGINGNGTKAKIANCYITDNLAYRRAGGLFNCDGPITNCRITNNTVTSDASTEGGGLHSCDGPITNCIIATNNSYGSSMFGHGLGGGLYACQGPITGCTITGNIAGGNGGGLYDCDGPLTGCVIAENKAIHEIFQSRGGGLCYCDGVISDCNISDNLAGESGGGVYRSHGVIKNCVVTGNQTLGYDGGGLAYCDFATNCTISTNSAAACGGGLMGCGTVANCIISGNSASNGGGLYGCGRAANCTITGNTASKGGGIYLKGGNLTVTNCLLWNNSATEANEIFLDFYIICGERGTCFKVPSTAIVTYSDVQGQTAGVHIESDCTLTWAEGNMDADPCFADSINDDYHLKSQAGRWNPSSQTWVKDEVTSPCIDAGDPASPIGLEPFPNGGIINMGAYGGTAEASKSYFGEPVCETIVAGDINGDCKVDFKDFALMAFHWLEDNNPR